MTVGEMTVDAMTVDDLLVLEEINTRLIEGQGGLKLYVQDAWPIIEPAQPYIGNWHIDAICDHLEAVTRGQIQDLIITVPPRHSKSIAVAVMWPTWEWGPANLPHTRWIFSSYAQSLSIRDSQKRRRIMEHPWYQSRWGGRFRIGGTRFTTDGTAKYENSHTGYHMATSVKGSNTGEGGNRIVVDDPINVKETSSEVIRASVNEWWDVVMSTRRNNANTDARVIIMQRTHEDDLVGHVLGKGSHGYVHLSLPTVYEGKACVTTLGKVDPRSAPGELMYPGRFGEQAVAQAKVDLGSYGFSAQHQQSPAPAEGGMLKKQWWKMWAPLGHPDIGSTFYPDGTRTIPGFAGCPVVARPRGFDQLAQSWDSSFKKHSETDYNVGQVWGKLTHNGKAVAAYLLHQKRARMSFTELQDEVVAMSMQWPAATLKLIEDSANGPAIIDSLRLKVNGLTAHTAEGSKDSRVAAVSPLLEAGNLYIPLPTLPGYEWVGEFIQECATFPNASHDDQVDAMTQLIIRWFNLQPFTSSHFGRTDL